MKLISVASLALVLFVSDLASAFTLPVAPTTTSISISATINKTKLQSQKLSDIDEMCIENVAELCLQADEALAADECNFEEHEALLNQLEDQKALLEAHVNRIDNLVHRLKADGLAKEEPEPTYFAG
ncbi:expressed unknown protein [Seminavis robusta]|uniref:Uncharacterized protein n=1 Tax=Seminavis robusta TaxID=568900 RepID=A0A9N8DKS2_9STRA|nr:expressed unknown protein [Seminavis robusta]|eukprot:Sro183_g079570.1 n/a (127) ;mRNA; r:12891-13271